MQVAKNFPGRYNVPYVAGMNTTALPTTTFSVSNTLASANVYGNDGEDVLGFADYLVIMWMPVATYVYGFPTQQQTTIPSSDKLGGLILKQFQSADLDTPFFTE